MGEIDAAAVKSLKAKTGASAAACKAALESAKGVEAKALMAMAKAGQLDPKKLDPDDVPETVFAAASLGQSRKASKGLGLPAGMMDLVASMPGMTEMFGRVAKADAEEERRQAPLRGRSLNDPVFGKLKWQHDVAWVGKATDCEHLGKKVAELTVESWDGDPPTEKQRAAYRAFLERESDVIAAVEKANWKYYQKVRPNYVSQMTPKHLKDMPELAGPADLWTLLSTPSVVIPEDQSKGWTVTLNWNCSWDPEHGHEAVVRKGKVVHVAVQGEGWE